MQKEFITLRLTEAELSILMTSLYCRIELLNKFNAAPWYKGGYLRLADKLTKKIADSKFRSLLAFI